MGLESFAEGYQMRLRTALPLLFAAALPLAAQVSVTPVAPPAKPAAPPVKPGGAASDIRRIVVAPKGGTPLPYSIEVPATWIVRQADGLPGLFIGPADAKPPDDPRLIWIRGSQVPLSDPYKVLESIQANDPAKSGWTAQRAEIKDLGGVRGVLVRVDSGTGDKVRSSLILKLPLADRSADFMMTADKGQFEMQQSAYEKMLLSVRPVHLPAPKAAPKPADKPAAKPPGETKP
jgi:hypothetical protein